MTIITNVKQKALISSDALAKWKVKVFGIGSIGSNLIKQLALVGFKDITGFDYDTVEAENIGSQEFRKEHIGLKKTVAIQKLMKNDFEYPVAVEDCKIDKETIILPEDYTIYFCAFDSLEARNMLWDKLKDFPIIWGESRIGRTAQRFYFVDLKKREEEWIEQYQKTLDVNGPRTELKCGEKGCYPAEYQPLCRSQS